MTIKIATRVKLIAVILAFSAAVTLARGQAAFKDDFSAPVNYLSNGVAGTIWDGIYLGAGEIARPMGIWMGPGSVSVADAGITKPGTLSISSLQTDWENDSDDGVFFFKVITGDFDMSVEVVGPIDSRAHNFPGLMVRAFGTNGAPSADGKENFLVWARFDEYSIANMLKNETDGKKRDTREGTYPNSNYWLRIQRAGNEFKLSEKASAGDAWSQVGSVTRADFAGRPLQVGIEHADFDGGRTLKAAYRNFSLTLSNMGPFAAAPLPPTNLKVTAKKPDGHVLTWAPGGESTGSVAVVWTGNGAVEGSAGGRNDLYRRGRLRAGRQPAGAGLLRRPCREGQDGDRDQSAGRHEFQCGRVFLRRFGKIHRVFPCARDDGGEEMKMFQRATVVMISAKQSIGIVAAVCDRRKLRGEPDNATLTERRHK